MEMFRGTDPVQQPYIQENARCREDRPRFDGAFHEFAESMQIDDFKFICFDEDPDERRAWAVDLCLRSFPYGSIAGIYEFAAMDSLHSGVRYNLRIDVHPVYFSIFSDSEIVYCGFSNGCLLEEEADLLFKHGFGRGPALRLSPRLNLARSFLNPGDLFKTIVG